MSSSPLVSVLVPICNVEKYLDQCLDSIQKQTFLDIEVICINDGSTDGSLGIIQSYVDRDSRFRLIDKQNTGYGDSMNRGIDAAKGKYIAIVESDDFLDSDALEYMASRSEEERLDVFKCNFWFYWSNPGEQRLYRKNLYHQLASTEMIAAGVHRARDLPEIFFAKASIWSALYRRDFLNENNIRFLPTPGASYQDAGFSFKVFALAERCAYSGRAFLHYRQDNESSSVNNPGKVYCICDEHREIKRFLYEDHPELRKELDPIRAKVKLYNYRWNYFRLGRDLQKEFLEQFSLEMREEQNSGVVRNCGVDMRGYDFAPGEVREVKEIAYQPDIYWVHTHSEGSKLRAVKESMRYGGPVLLIKAIKYWFFKN